MGHRQQWWWCWLVLLVGWLGAVSAVSDRRSYSSSSSKCKLPFGDVAQVDTDLCPDLTFTARYLRATGIIYGLHRQASVSTSCGSVKVEVKVGSCSFSTTYQNFVLSAYFNDTALQFYGDFKPESCIDVDKSMVDVEVKLTLSKQCPKVKYTLAASIKEDPVVEYNYNCDRNCFYYFVACFILFLVSLCLCSSCCIGLIRLKRRGARILKDQK